MNLDNTQAIEVLNANIVPPDFILTAREQSDILFALIHGDNFLELLIHKIEGLESDEKAKARQKYSRNIVHYYARLLRPNSNVYSANGGSVAFDLDDADREKLAAELSRARDGKSLREWLKTKWMPLLHADPNGVTFIEYETQPQDRCWPTHKNIHSIRSYKPKGQLVDWILFEPFKTKVDGSMVDVYRLVDDTTDRKYYKKAKEWVILKTIKGARVTFNHSFGKVPCLINSDIEKFRYDYRLSPVHVVVDMSEEYAGDQSVKSIYKKLMGFPREWKYVDQCDTCIGSGKFNDAKCTDCDGHGYYRSNDITDIRTLPLPDKDDVKIAPDISGYIAPELETWTQYTEELAAQFEMAYSTYWGTMAGFVSKVQKTATEVFYDTQPMTDKLNDLSDLAESQENQIVEWFANFHLKHKSKDVMISSIHYGRRFIIDPPDVILVKYHDAKDAEDSSVILDRMYNEYLTAKFRRDPEFLRVMLLKSSIEPYLHLGDTKTLAYFGSKEVQKKILFQKWWDMIGSGDTDKTAEKLTKDFEAWFALQNTIDPNEGGDE